MARIEATRRWLQRIVVAGKLCPFAPPVSAEPKLRLRAVTANSEEEVIAQVASEALWLRKGIAQPDAGLPETSLLVLPPTLDCVATWSSFVNLSWRLQAEALVANSLAEHIQIVLFHPAAVHSMFSEGAEEDPADYAIRSPFPTVHLLREVDMLAAVHQYPDPQGIPARNKERLRALGARACAERLASCVEATRHGSSARSETCT